MKALFDLTPGDSPLLISIPHAGTDLPADIAARLTPEARGLSDTDWHVPRLYDFAGGMGATLLVARLSRYAIDLNRPPDGASLYPGAATTGLCPTESFDGMPLYAPGQEPDSEEIAIRTERFHAPYHRALADTVDDIRQRFGYVLLYDAHSIRSSVPRLFDGELPGFNIGTNGGASAASGLSEAVEGVCRMADDYSTVVNGRFRGGYITRHYGDPARHIHAIQMELGQKIYMTEAPPWAFDDAAAARLRPVLIQVVQAMRDWAG